MVDPVTIREAVRSLLGAAPPGSQVILFGSYARGQATEESDLDFLVVEPAVADQHQEMVRLRQALRPLRVPVDVLVTSQERFAYWRDTPNTVYFEAATQGQVYEQVA